MVGPREFELTRNSWYEASATRPPASPPLAGRVTADVCVVGGGYAGLSAPDDLDHAFVLETARPYLGEVVGVYGDWTPLRDRGWPFGEEVDSEDPWQFINMRVT